MDYYEIVCRLVGPIQPVGKSNEDIKRLHNIGDLIDLVDRLLVDIASAAVAADRPESSMKKIGKAARDFMSSLAG